MYTVNTVEGKYLSKVLQGFTAKSEIRYSTYVTRFVFINIIVYVSAAINTLEQKSHHYELIEVQKGLQCICHAKTVVGIGITPSVALLVHISVIVHPVLDCHEFTRSHIRMLTRDVPIH